MVLSPPSEPPSVAGVDGIENNEAPAFGVNVSNNCVFGEDGSESVDDGTAATEKSKII